MTPELTNTIQQLIRNPALIETINALAAALEEPDGLHRLAAINEACISPHELDTLLEQIDTLAAALKKCLPTGH